MKGTEVDCMTGYINNILTADSGYEYGYITGDDGNSYYFDERHLSGKVNSQIFSTRICNAYG